MNDKRFPKILKGLAVCAGYAAAFLGLMAVKAALIILLCIGLLMGATRACLTEHASPHRRGKWCGIWSRRIRRRISSYPGITKP